MPQPPSVDAASEALRSLYTQAQQVLDAELRAIAADPSHFRRRRFLEQLSDRVHYLMAELDRLALPLTRATIEATVRLGWEDGQVRLGPPRSSFAVESIEAVQIAAADLYDDLLRATSYVRQSAKRLVREAGSAAVRNALLAGRTAPQAAVEMTRWLEDHGLHSVTYRNGARVQLGDYADMAIRTKTAVAYNEGTFANGAANGVTWYEVFDGLDCGWSTHYGNPKAHGLIVPEAAAREYPIAHPRCRRSFGGRPDVRSSGDAKRAPRSTTEQQDAAQRAAQEARLARQQQAAARRARATRVQTARAQRLEARASRVRG